MSTPSFNIKLNQAGKDYYGANSVDVQLRFGMTPAGHSFQIWFRTEGQSAFRMLTSYGDWYQGDVLPIIAEMNRVGMIEFINQKVAPWFIKQMQNLFGAYVDKGTGPVVVPGNTVIDLPNLDAIANGTLAMFSLVDANGDGLPELIKV